MAFISNKTNCAVTQDMQRTLYNALNGVVKRNILKCNIEDGIQGSQTWTAIETNLNSLKQELLLAQSNWDTMTKPERMKVIDAFYALADVPLRPLSNEQRTILFCKIFIQELAPLLFN